MKIISADERLKQHTGVKLAIFGRYGLGKTSLLKTLDEPTLCLDFEAGLLAVKDCWDGDVISIRGWEKARELACLLGKVSAGSPACYGFSNFCFNPAKYNYLDFSKYQCIFIDSITFASKLCLHWCKNQIEPQLKKAESDKSTDERSKKLERSDNWAIYGLLATEMSVWLNIFQHITDKDVIFVGLLDSSTDAYNRMTWLPQIEGAKTTLELPGILDEVISMIPYKNEQGEIERKFVCQNLNRWSFPAKDRSGRLDEIEDADLGKLLKKIKGGK